MNRYKATRENKSVMHILRKSLIIRQLALVFMLGLQAPLLVAQAPGDPAPSVPATTESTVAPTLTTSDEKPIFSSIPERDNALLAIARPTEVQWLETPNEKIIALFKAGETRKTQGSLLILHAPELPQLWPAPLESLRRNFPIYGWDTMTVPLPSAHSAQTLAHSKSLDTHSSDESQLSSAASSPITSSAVAATDNSSTATAQTSSAPNQEIIASLPRAQLIIERVGAAIALLGKIGQPNLVVVVDNSSAPDSLAELYKKNIQALVLVNLQEQEPLTQEQLAAIFSVTKLPVMDVFFSPDDQFQIEVRRLHHAEAMRKNLKDYHQLILPPEHIVTVNDSQSFWLDKVRGFIKKTTGKTTTKK